MNSNYQELMRKAIDLAKKGRFKTCPNPCVGAILIKEDQIIGSGWHHASGSRHAEIECIENARNNGHDIKNSTMIVTLEPCNHYGKTPPCADALLDAGIKRLVYGTEDVNKKAAGGLEKLKNAGIEIIGPICKEECDNLIADFTVWQKKDRPYIFLKLASTLDGRIATRSGHSKWISCEKSRENVHFLRSQIGQAEGAILIGGGTFRADNPKLTARCSEAGQKQPLACILTSRLPKVDSNFYLIKNSPERTVFFSSPAASASTTAESLRKLGCKIFAIGQTPAGEPDFAKMFHILLQELNCYYVLCEGGGQLALSLLENNYIDEFHLHIAPLILGDNSALPLFSGRHPLGLEEAIKMRFESCYLYGADSHLILRPINDSF